MDKKNYYVGFDTSNYTTSIAACDTDGNVIANVKIPLQVREGERGLRQSDALFLHTKNLADIYADFNEKVKDYGQVLAVCASEKPRDAKDSYMPCFLSGKAAAIGYGQALKIPVYFTSHQDGHIMAAVYSASNNKEDNKELAVVSELFQKPFAAFHVSGGTTEILYVDGTSGELDVKKIGGSADLNAGQAIDRAGVMMGIKFPCGPQMERLAMQNSINIPKPRVSVNNLECCLSGLENLSAKLYKDTGSTEATSLYILEFIAETLNKMTENLRNIYEDIPIIYAGGVMSNSIIKSRLSKRNKVYFAQPAFSADNAAGVALICRKKHIENLEK